MAKTSSMVSPATPVIEYGLLAGNPVQIIVLVNEWITQGWQPFGGPALRASDSTFFQAMVRYE